MQGIIISEQNQFSSQVDLNKPSRLGVTYIYFFSSFYFILMHSCHFFGEKHVFTVFEKNLRTSTAGGDRCAARQELGMQYGQVHLLTI